MNQKEKHRYAVFVSGRGSNLKAILESVKTGVVPYKPSLVLTDNPDAPALNYARENGVETCYINPKENKGRKKMAAAMINELRSRGITHIALAGFMRILHEDLVNAFEGNIINIHPSLLPDFPGLEPQKRALEAGVKEAGCTVHFVDNGVDTGAIIRQARVPVLESDDLETLSARILEQEHMIYPRVLAELLAGKVRLEDGKAVFE